jgi:hypothetical protein
MPAGGSHFICCYSEDDGTSAVPRDVVVVVFDGQDRVVEKTFIKKGVDDAPRRLKNRIREWLGL